MIDESVSIVIAVVQRHDDFVQLVEEYDAAIRTCVARYEFVIVIDGDFPDIAKGLKESNHLRDRPIRLVQFTRTFGYSTAISVGIDKSQGDLIFTLPSFYQIEPQSLPEFVAALEDFDLIEGRRWPRRDSRLNRFGTALYHKIIKLVTGHTFRDLGCSARLMRRKVIEEIVLYGEQSAFLPILAATRGFKIRELSVPQSAQDPYLRYYGPGVYMRRIIDVLTVFFLTRFTKAPLRFFGVVGSMFVGVAVALIGYVAFDRLIYDLPAADRPVLLFGVVFFVVGIQFFALGLIGELIIFVHGREMKEYSIAEVVNLHDAGSGEPLGRRTERRTRPDATLVGRS